MSDYIWLFVGKSGVGKSAVADYLAKNHNLKILQSYTTRPRRFDNEKGHIFISESEFKQLTDIVAYTKFDTYEYCATTEQIENSDIYIIDAKGIEAFKELYEGEKTPIIIYLTASVDNLIKRMRARGDSVEKVMSRVNHDEQAFTDVNYDIKIDTDNKTIKEVADEVLSLINR